jgi:putative oxidoreductase
MPRLAVPDLEPALRVTSASSGARDEAWRTKMVDVLFEGIGGSDIALLLNRIAVGLFFMFSGYHKLFNAQRHRVLVDELKALRIPALTINQWWVPLVEFSAGSAVVIGLLAPLAAFGLIVLILIASMTSGRQRIKTFMPIDRADRIDDWLYLPETLYAFMLLIIVSAGAGPYSVDAVIVGLIDPGMTHAATNSLAPK